MNSQEARPSPQTARPSAQSALSVKLTACTNYRQEINLTEDFCASVTFEQVAESARKMTDAIPTADLCRQESGDPRSCALPSKAHVHSCCCAYAWNSTNKEQTSITSRTCTVNCCGLLFLAVCVSFCLVPLFSYVFSAATRSFSTYVHVYSFRKRPVGRNAR